MDNGTEHGAVNDDITVSKKNFFISQLFIRQQGTSRKSMLRKIARRFLLMFAIAIFLTNGYISRWWVLCGQSCRLSSPCLMISHRHSDVDCLLLCDCRVDLATRTSFAVRSSLSQSTDLLSRPSMGDATAVSLLVSHWREWSACSPRSD